MKILVVENEIRQQEWLTRSLSDAGHEVHFARDGDSALAMYKTLCPFDVVVTNSLLPKRAWSGDRVVEVAVRKGTHLIECIRAIDPGQPFIVRAESESMELTRGVPMLRKPYKIGSLMRVLASAGSQRLPLFDHPLAARSPDACAGEAFIHCRALEMPR
jgi:CheY-like chemotaxis protein